MEKEQVVEPSKKGKARPNKVTRSATLMKTSTVLRHTSSISLLVEMHNIGKGQYAHQ